MMRRLATVVLVLGALIPAAPSEARLDAAETEAICRAVPEWLRAAARAGDPEAQASLGALLIDGGCGTGERAMGEGLAWLERASAQGHSDAAALLGDLYLSGILAPPDAPRALRHYRRAAEGGHVLAQHRLGILLVAAGDRDSREEGLYWLGAASSAGDGMAAVAVGLLHARGLHGVPRDACLASDWYEAGRLIGAPLPIAQLEAELGADALGDCD
jgi:uncharacterized protein